MIELEDLFPDEVAQQPGNDGPKRRKLKASLATLAWPFKQKRAKKIVEEISQYKATINLTLTIDSHQAIKDVKAKAKEIHDLLTDTQRHDVYKWLVTTDPSPIHNGARSRYEPGTGDWMLRSPNWKNWIGSNSRCLWIHGIPGAGKTVLMSYLIEQVKQHCQMTPTKRQAHAYYYNYFGHSQDEAAPFLRSILNQLCRQADTVTLQVYSMYKRGAEPPLTELLDALEEILDFFDKVYISIDALDESAPRHDQLRMIRDLATDERFRKIKLLASSREYVDIEEVMEVISVPVSMSNPFVEDDIRLLVKTQLKTRREFRRWPEDLLLNVEDAVTTGAQGMFRWAVCQIEVIRRLKCDRPLVKSTLKNLPTTLNETYDRIFLNIPVEDRLWVYHVLGWICFDQDLAFNNELRIRSPTLLKAATASATHVDAHHQTRYYDLELLRELCGCLIQVSEPSRLDGSMNVILAHYTVREYLELPTKPPGLQELHELFPVPLRHTLQATVFERVLHMADAESEERCFTDYCASQSIEIMMKNRNISESKTLSALAIDVLDPSKSHFGKFYDRLEEINGRTTFSSHLGAKWDIRDPDELDAIKLFNIPELIDGFGTLDAPLALARVLLREKDARTVLNCILRVEMKDFRSEEVIEEAGTIIQLTAIQELVRIRPEVYSFLLERGAVPRNSIEMLVHWARNRGEPEYFNESFKKFLLRRLIQEGADVDALGYRVTPLQIAALHRHAAIVEVLLKAGANPNMVGSKTGLRWEDWEGVYMDELHEVHGLSPLYICRRLDLFLGIDQETRVEKAAKAVIEKLLLEHGAEESYSDLQYEGRYLVKQEI